MSGLPTDTVEVTGSDVQPIVAALGLVVAAAGLAVLATRRHLRRVVGVLAVLAALGILVALVTGSGARESALESAVAESTAFTGDNRPDGSTQAFWLWSVGLAAVLAAALGVLTTVWASAWPSMGGRYEAPGATAQRTSDVETADGADLWKALDEGRDPTV